MESSKRAHPSSFGCAKLRGRLELPLFDVPGWSVAIEALADGVALLDAGDRCVSSNAVLRRLVGEVPLGTSMSSLPWARAALETRGVPHPVQLGERWLELRCNALEGGGSVLVVTDITAQVQAREQLRQSTDVMTALFDAAPIAIVALDLQRRITHWNQAAERTFGWSFEEVRGQSFLQMVPQDEHALFIELVDRVFAGVGFTGVEVSRLHKSGRRVVVAVNAAPLRDTSGRVVGTMAALEDRTERRQLEEQMRRVERMEAIGRLAGGVAHDFNNLLTVILSACDLLEADPPDRRRLIGDVRRGAERAAELTRQLLAFSRRQVLQPAPVDLSEAVQGAATMLVRLIGEDIGVRLDLHEAPLPVLADRGQLERVVLNLGINARDAMPRGGRLLISTGPAEDLPTHLRRGEYVELVVQDTGGGMEAGVLPHIFEPFFTTKAPGEGTGLGLSMVYGVVQQSGGEVLVESRPGRGTTFRVLLPLLEGDAASESSLPPASQRDDLAPRRARPAGDEEVVVLLVEDDDEVRATLEELLSALGYQVLSASGGDQALAVSDAYEGPIRLLLTDVVMAGMSGREVAEAIQARRSETRVLFMSGYTDDAVLRHGVRAGASFLQKPFTSRALGQVLRQLLAEEPR